MAYNAATFTRLFVNSQGIATIELTYTGNAGEPPLVYQYAQDLSVMPTADFIRGQAMARISNLNTTQNFVTGATPFVGTVLDTTTPLPVTPSTIGSFIAASAPFTPPATPTDVAVIFGSATKTVTVTKVAITTIQTTAGINAWSLIKRSTANTGGTASALTRVPINSNYPAATALVQSYTANPTTGTTIGNIWSGRVVSPSISSVIGGYLETVLLPQFTSPVILSGIAQGLAVNFGGIALPPGLSVQVIFCWNEN